MKKLLGFLGAIGLVATSGASVVACGNDPKETTKDFALLTTDVVKKWDGVLANTKDNTTDVKSTFKYKEFFNKDGVEGHVNYLDNVLYGPLTSTNIVGDANATDFAGQVLDWSHDALTLVLGYHAQGSTDLTVKKEFSANDNEKTLEELWEANVTNNQIAGMPDGSIVTMAVKVKKEVRNVKLAKDYYLTFTFTDTGK